MSVRSARQDLAAVAGYIAIACLFFWPILFTNLILAGYDTFTIFYPHRALAARALLEGRLPLWNPGHFLGAPLLANPQVAVLYPPNWPFLGLGAGKALGYTMVFHIVLAAVFMYVFARRRAAIGGTGAFAAGLIFAWGGFVGEQTGHLNQVSVLAWLPLLLLAGQRAWERPSPRRVAVCAGIVALQLLAGHTQESYMLLVTLLAYSLYLAWRAGRPWLSRANATRLGALAAAVALGSGLAAMQLLPTLELSALSIRSGGLSYRQASSFSLNPLELPLALLPGYTASAPSEMSAYIGVSGVLLALVGLRWGRDRRLAWFLALAALAGLLLALGRYSPLYYVAYHVAPGVSLFRAPARWLLPYTFALALLAGMGLDVLLCRGVDGRRLLRLLAGAVALVGLALLAASPLVHLPPPATLAGWAAAAAAGMALMVLLAPRRRRLFAGVLLALLLGELYLAGHGMEYNRLAPPESLTAWRPAPAAIAAQGGLYRALSVSDATFDPGDLAEIKAGFGNLAPALLSAYLDALKNKELLTANLPQLFGIQTADGYDGGVLPLRRYVDMEALFLPSDELSPDGRLRDHLPGIPQAPLLALLNIGYVVTDKNHDAWLDNAYYDLSLQSRVHGRLDISAPQDFVATQVGMVARLAEAGQASRQGAQLVLRGAGGETQALDVSAALLGGAPRVQTRDGAYAHVLLSLPQPLHVAGVSVRYDGPGELELRGLTLIDGRTGAALSLAANPDFELVHSGDVKIYRVGTALPRAYVVHAARVVPAAQTVAALKEPTFAEHSEALLELAPGQTPPPLAPATGAESVRVMGYAPERVEVETDLSAAGLLVLADAWYPGWQAMVDGAPAEILRANHLLRAVAVPAGRHVVVFSYRPSSLGLGALASGVSGLLALGALLRRRRP